MYKFISKFVEPHVSFTNLIIIFFKKKIKEIKTKFITLDNKKRKKLKKKKLILILAPALRLFMPPRESYKYDDYYSCHISDIKIGTPES